jgi:hypothetical protein
MVTRPHSAPDRAPPDEGAAPSEPAERRRRWPQWLTVAAVSSLISLAAGALGLVFVVRPNWRPDPGERQVAQATVVDVEPGVSIADYVGRIGREVPNVMGDYVGVGVGGGADTRITRCLPGDVYYIQQNLEGFKDRSTSIVKYTYDSKTRLRLRGAFQTVSGGGPILDVKHSRTIDQSVVPVWVQWPFRAGRFFVRFEIFHKKAFLTLVNASPFSMTQERYRDFVQRCANAKQH